MSVEIPVIDFQRYNVHVKEHSDEDAIRRIGLELRDAFQTFGFCYIKNLGIEDTLVSDYFSVARSFFEQPVEEKGKYALRSDCHVGWAALEREVVNPDRPADLKESFDYHPEETNAIQNLSELVERLQAVNRNLYQLLTGVTYRIIDVLSMALGLEDKSFLRNCHKKIGAHGNTTVLRSLYYPPIAADSKVKPGQIRIGEHTDYGTMTLLFQDDAGGLESQIPGGDFVPAPPVAGTCLVYIGDLMQRWTADVFKATVHRVVIPESELTRRRCRQSLAYFVHPEDDFVVRCLDGSDKYEPISSVDYLDYKYSVTY